MTTHKLHIGLSLAPTWHAGEAWRRPNSAVETAYSPDFALDLARRAEAAHLDFIFRPDSLALHRSQIGQSSAMASLDPTLQLAAIAQNTHQIGLVTTASTSFMPPYILARQLQSLHWLSDGRAGWNIVTSLDGHGHFGLAHMPPAAARYARAKEAVDVIRALWHSFPPEALLLDKDAGQFANPDLIRPIFHDGAEFCIEGPLNLPAHPAPLPLFQAGASDIGRGFAAGISDAIFASCPDMEAGQELRTDLQARAVAQGRRAEDIRLLPGLSLFLAETEDAALSLFRATHARSDPNRHRAHIKALTGLDVSDMPLDTQITSAMLPSPLPAPRSRTHAELLRRVIAREAPRLSDLMNRPEVISSGHWTVIGTPDMAARAIADWQDGGAMDGFVALPGGSVESLGLFFDALVPRLKSENRLRQSYESAHLAGHLERH